MKTILSFIRWAALLSLPFFLVSIRAVEIPLSDLVPPPGPAPAAAPEEASALDAVTIYGRSVDLIGEATTSSQGRVGARELAERPFLRRGELLEVVPGVVVTQHSGGGKANQYFLRGFNLDHGTDFSISVQDMPVNMRSHAHGQGYADINFIIPETVQAVNYEKGPFYAQLGDFSSAGAAQYLLVPVLPLGFETVEIGENNFFRAAVGQSFRTSSADYTAAFESSYDDGPSKLAEQFQRYSTLLKRHWGKDENQLDLTGLGYFGKWRSTDQIPQRAVQEGIIDRFGNIDPTDGGQTNRDSLSLDWSSEQGNATTHLNAYAIYYQLSLFSNFTYFLDDPVNGDQFNQADQRLVWGGSLVRDWESTLGSTEVKQSIGLQVRDDIAQLSLHKTKDRSYLSTIRDDHIQESSVGVFGKSEFHWNNWLRSEAGLRADFYRFQVKSSRRENTATRSAGILSPKLGLVFGPWRQTEYYLNAGLGFHSNDARGVTSRVDPLSGDPVEASTPLVRTKSIEGGLRTSLVKDLVSTASLFYLASKSELVLAGDDGSITPTGATRRYGVELSNFYHITKWLTVEGDVSFTNARYRDDSAGGRRIPNSISTVVTGGATVDLPNGLSGSLRLRYFGPQPLTEDDQVLEPSSIIFNGRIGYRHLNWDVALDILNILDRKNDDIQYFYRSRLAGEPSAGIDDVHSHPNEPRQFRVSLSRHF